MTEIKLINGSKVAISAIQIKGNVIDSNGSLVGGSTTFVFGADEVSALNDKLPLQQVYDAIYGKSNDEQTDASK